MKNLCFIDIETTGSIFGYHEIIDIGAIKTSSDGVKELGRKSALIKPNFPERITETALELNGFNTMEWEHAEFSNSTIWSEFIQFWDDCVPICHNPSFERAFITLAINACGIDDTGLGYHWIGTESLAWPLIYSGKIKKISLSSLLDYYGLKTEGLPHKAINGATACRDVYIKIMNTN